MKSSLFLILGFVMTIVAYGQLDNASQTFLSKDGKVKMIRFNPKANVPNVSESLSLIKENFNLSINDQLILKSINVDDSGIEHKRFYQVHSGIKVENAEIIVHSKAGNILSINGEAGIIDKIILSPTIDSEKSIEIACLSLNAKKYAWESPEMEAFIQEIKKDKNATYAPKPELVLWNKDDSTGYFLAYKLHIVTLEPNNSYGFHIDAHTGEILDVQSQDLGPTSEAITRYSGGVSISTSYLSGVQKWQLKDNTRGNGIETRDCNNSLPSNSVSFLDNNDYWTEWHNGEMDDAALDAHYGGMKTYDYFKNIHNRNSYDNLNGAIYIYVHANWGVDLNNASWDPQLNIIKCSDGTGNNEPFTAEEVIAHEFGHGLTYSYSDLYHWGEPGAIDEGLSQIWGICVEEYANLNGSQKWIEGEDYIDDPLLRKNFQSPNSTVFWDDYLGEYYPYPDTYQGDGWHNTQWDYNARHEKAVVLSHWFYLLSNGGIGENDNGYQYNVLPIGTDIASKITYKLYNYISYNMDFSLAFMYLCDIASNTYGSNSNIAIQTNNAWFAVGIGREAANLITGNPYICTSSNYTYSLPPEFEGETIAWNTSSNIQIISGQNTRAITVRKISNGAGTISAVYNHGNGDIISQKTVWIGPPLLSYIDGPSSGEPYNSYSFSAYPSYDYHSGASYSWYLSPLNGNSIYPSYDHADIYFYNSGFYQVVAQASNTCGSSDYAIAWIEISGGGYYLLNPNPASSEVTITVNQSKLLEREQQNINTIYTVSIYNFLGTLQYKNEFSGEKFNIPVYNLKEGNYIIKINNGKTETSDQIIIKH